MRTGTMVSPDSERAGAPRLKAIFAGYCPRCCRGAVLTPGLRGLCVPIS